MIRIVYLIDTFIGPSGGTENQILRMIDRLDPARFSFSLFTLQRSRWLEGRTLPFPARSLGFRSFRSLDYFRCRNEFVAYCRDNKIDIVQTFFRDSNILGLLWGRRAGVKTLIASRRNIGTGYWHNWVEVRILRSLAKYTTHYIANSGAAARETTRVEKVDPGRISQIPNCLDVAAFDNADSAVAAATRRRWGLAANGLVVGAVANLRPIKNLPFLIRAAQTVTTRHPHVAFVVLGEGPQRPELERLIAALGLQGRFVLAGLSENVARDLQAMDVTVLCSKSESSPNAVLEYMAAGKACIIADVGGNSELIASGDTGYTYPAGNRERFVELLSQVLDHAERRQRLGTRARAAVQSRHDCRVVVPRLEHLYESLVAAGRGA
jgi:glycosyltransferase involved in cell wall biosynthesis